MKVMVIFGTRPEAIKMCPVIRRMRHTGGIKVSICVTGQHREMLRQVLDVFGVSPDYNLDIMRKSQTLAGITSEILTKLPGILYREKPQLVLVHGDTSTAFAAALSCFYQQIPVGHVEAGLRTHDMDSPFPEEFNRQAVDLIARFYFAPTVTAKKNLIAEGKRESDIFVTGNTVIDALSTTVRQEYRHEELDWAKDSRLLLMTAHRRENLGDSMRQMFRAIRKIVEAFRDVKVIYPVHLNPEVKAAAEKELGGCSRVHLIEPLDVLDFHNFMARSYLILTDSGGIQEEAPALGKPVLVMRDTTERPEGVKAGTLKLVGTDEDMIFKECARLLTDEEAYRKMNRAANPYGDGRASERIVSIIEKMS